jgi:hypothetical protein
MGQKSWAEMLDESASESANSGNFDPIPEGEYELKITNAESRFSGSGKKMYVVTAEVQDGPYASRKLWHNFVITEDNPKAMNIFFGNMEALGIAKDYFRSNPADDAIVKALLGRKFRGAVGKRIYNDRERNEIRRFYGSRGTTGIGVSNVTPASTSLPASPPVVSVSTSSTADAGIPSIPTPF